MNHPDWKISTAIGCAKIIFQRSCGNQKIRSIRRSDLLSIFVFAKNILALREISKEFAEDNQKLGELLEQVIDNIEQDKDRYKGQDIAVVVNQMRYDAIDTEIKTFAKLWNLNEDDVRYEVYNYRDGEMANENTFKDRAYASYKEGVEEPMPKFKFRKIIVEKFKHDLMENVLPLRDW